MARYREAVRNRVYGLERAGLLQAPDPRDRVIYLPVPEVRAAAERAMERLPRDVDSDSAMPRWARDLDRGPFKPASPQLAGGSRDT